MAPQPPPDKPDRPVPVPLVDDGVKQPKTLPVEPPTPDDSPEKKES